jgi:hypothetical protein
MKPKPALLLLIGAACAGYLIAFLSTGRMGDINTFDSIMTQDMAQIARNTLRGNILETKYILPVAYARFRTVENHPDYIRYPLPVLIYALLFSVAPDSPAAIKALNGILFVLNTALVYYMALCLFRRQNHWIFPLHWFQGLAALCALGSSLLVLPYFRLALADAHEILTVTVLLIAFIATFIRMNPVLAGVSATLLYLSRSNMAVFAPLMLSFLIVRTDGRKQKVRAAAIFFTSSFLAILPFLLRNMVLAHEPFFSLQQSVELLNGVKGSHEVLYRSFALPPSLLPLSPDQFHALSAKIAHNLKQPILFAMNRSYLPAWGGLLLFAYFFKKERLLLITCLAFVLFHVAACSLFLQLPRVYVPVFFLPAVLGYVGLVAVIATLLRSVPRRVAAGILMFFPLLVTLSPLALQNRLHNNPDVHTRPPSSAAVRSLQDRGICCVYANNPFWIPWYADIISVYAPVDSQEMLDKGPPQCSYYMADKRFRFPSGFLNENAQVLYDDNSCILFQFARGPNEEVQQ